MNNEQERKKEVNQRVNEILAKIEKDTIKIDYSLQGTRIVTREERAAKERERERKRIEKERNKYKRKPAFLVSLASIFEELAHIILTLYIMAIVVNILFIWEIYNAVSAGGWLAVFQSKYTLYILAYFVLLFILKKVYSALYEYANE